MSSRELKDGGNFRFDDISCDYEFQNCITSVIPVCGHKSFGTDFTDDTDFCFFVVSLKFRVLNFSANNPPEGCRLCV